MTECTRTLRSRQTLSAARKRRRRHAAGRAVASHDHASGAFGAGARRAAGAICEIAAGRRHAYRHARSSTLADQALLRAMRAALDARIAPLTAIWAALAGTLLTDTAEACDAVRSREAAVAYLARAGRLAHRSYLGTRGHPDLTRVGPRHRAACAARSASALPAIATGARTGRADAALAGRSTPFASASTITARVRRRRRIRAALPSRDPCFSPVSSCQWRAFAALPAASAARGRPPTKTAARCPDQASAARLAATRTSRAHVPVAAGASAGATTFVASTGKAVWTTLRVVGRATVGRDAAKRIVGRLATVPTRRHRLDDGGIAHVRSGATTNSRGTEGSIRRRAGRARLDGGAENEPGENPAESATRLVHQRSATFWMTTLFASSKTRIARMAAPDAAKTPASNSNSSRASSKMPSFG